MATLTMKHPDFESIEARVKLAGLESGDVFQDAEGAPCIYIGNGGYRKPETVPISVGSHQIGTTFDLEFKPVSHLFVYLYKGEWFLYSFEEDPSNIPGNQPT